MRNVAHSNKRAWKSCLPYGRQNISSGLQKRIYLSGMQEYNNLYEFIATGKEPENKIVSQY